MYLYNIGTRGACKSGDSGVIVGYANVIRDGKAMTLYVMELNNWIVSESMSFSAILVHPDGFILEEKE